MRRTGIVIGVLAAFGLLLASPASAQGYPHPKPSCHLEPTSVQAGATAEVEGFNWLPQSTVSLTFFTDPTSLGTAQADQNGKFQKSVQIPSDASVGDHTIQASGTDLDGNPATVSCPAVVVAAAAAPAPGGVAFTGTNVSLGLVILIILVVAGLGLIVAGRRRKTHANN
ncbi:MAG TPA: hypothetical protein VF972_05640 [Actinomycetota bacterium]